jgi:hypothetical protein
LKALKRVEVQTSHSDSFFNMPKTSDTKQANTSNERRRWFIPGLMTSFLVLLIIVIAAIILFSRRQPVITKKFPAGVTQKQKENPPSLLEKSNIYRAKIPSGFTNLSESPSKKAPLAKNQIQSAVPADNVKEMPAKARSTMPAGTVNQQDSTTPGPQPKTAATLEQPLQKRPTSKDTAASKKSVAVRSVPSGKPATKAKKADQTSTYDRIDDSKLKLQALAWFNDASKRMAVINSRIVREGGSVDGFQVTQIRRQDVVVSDGKKSWRLEFGIKY